MNIRHYENLISGAESRREYTKTRKAGRTPENSVFESLACFEDLEFRGANGQIDHKTKDWFLAEIAAIRALLPIAKI